jgi:DNA-binding transcriptional LysR family regulator
VGTIIFLDFDGVLHPEIGDAEPFCCRSLFWAFLRQRPQIDVVFSTSWREFHVQEELVQFVTQGGGEDLVSRFIGSTPLVRKLAAEDDYRKRERECLAWLEGNGLGGRPWLALDDVDYWFSSSSPNLHLVDYRTGITPADIAALLDRVPQ